MDDNYFPKRPLENPRIYAYEDTNPQYKGLLKIGFTNRCVVDRVAEQYPTRRPGRLPYRILLDESAMREDGTIFLDHEVHRALRSKKIPNPEGEWFKCDIKNIKSVILSIKDRSENYNERIYDFKSC